MINCAFCGKPFQQIVFTQKYCNVLCQHRAKSRRQYLRKAKVAKSLRKLLEINCAFCSEPFQQTIFTQKYCSIKCQQRAASARQYAKIVIKKELTKERSKKAAAEMKSHYLNGKELNHEIFEQVSTSDVEKIIEERGLNDSEIHNSAYLRLYKYPKMYVLKRRFPTAENWILENCLDTAEKEGYTKRELFELIEDSLR